MCASKMAALSASSRAHTPPSSSRAVRLAASYRARCSPALPPCPAYGGAGTNGS